MKTKIIAALAAPAIVAGAVAGGVALADPVPDVSYDADLMALNDSGATGTVELSLDGTMLTVSIEASGLTPDLPHAQHIHGTSTGGACPPAEADTDGDGFISVAEGGPFYGGVLVSLTTSGDTGAESALALDRYPVADGDGDIDYERTFEVSPEIAANLAKYHVVQHGIDLDTSGAYDGDKPSSINPEVPFEATVPANCGTIDLDTVGDQQVDRVGGATRFETSAMVSMNVFPDGADTVYLARADEFADALTAGTVTDGPILLVPSCGDLPGAIADEIDRLDPDTIVALGGSAAICDDVLVAAAEANS